MESNMSAYYQPQLGPELYGTGGSSCHYISPEDWLSNITAKSTPKDFEMQCLLTLSYPALLGQGHFNKALKDAEDIGNMRVRNYIAKLNPEQYVTELLNKYNFF